MRILVSLEGPPNKFPNSPHRPVALGDALGDSVGVTDDEVAEAVEVVVEVGVADGDAVPRVATYVFLSA